MLTALGSRTVLLVDDIPLLTGSSGEARWDFAPLENLQQVEIIKGASSALYGSSALNGVVNIRTAFASYEPKTSINLTSGIYDNPKRDAIKWWNTSSPFYSGVRFSHAQKFGNADLVLGANAYSETGYQENNEEQRMRVNMNFRYRSRKIEGLSSGINFNYMDRTGSQFLLWLDGNAGVWQANPTFQQSYHNTSFNLYPYITYFPNQNTKHSLKTRLYSIHNKNNTGQNNIDDTYFAEYQFQKTFAQSTTITSGVSGSYIESLSEIYGNDKHFGSNLALYSQLDKKLFSRLNLSFGGRLEGYRLDEDYLKFLPLIRTGLNYSIDEFTFKTLSAWDIDIQPFPEKYTATSSPAIRIFRIINRQNRAGSEIAMMRGFQINWYGYVDIAYFGLNINMIEFMFDYHNPDSVTLVASPIPTQIIFKTGLDLKQKISEMHELAELILLLKVKEHFWFTSQIISRIHLYKSDDADAKKHTNNTSTNSNILKYRFYHNLKLDYEIQYHKISWHKWWYCSPLST